MTSEATKPRPQAELEAQGWRRMSTNDEPRLSELVESYQELGYEVHLEPVHLEEESVCKARIAEPERYRTIYIRKLAEGILPEPG